MIWPLPAILTALCESLKDLFGERNVRERLPCTAIMVVGVVVVTVLS
jgi:hypothetical protein